MAQPVPRSSASRIWLPIPPPLSFKNISAKIQTTTGSISGGTWRRVTSQTPPTSTTWKPTWTSSTTIPSTSSSSTKAIACWSSTTGPTRSPISNPTSPPSAVSTPGFTSMGQASQRTPTHPGLHVFPTSAIPITPPSPSSPSCSKINPRQPSRIWWATTTPRATYRED